MIERLNPFVMEVTSLDLSILDEEFQQLEDGHVQKVYQRKDELTLEIYVPGEDKKRLLIGPDRAFLTKYKRDNPTRPPGFCMELRKHLGRIDEIKQRGFDRILVLKSGDIKLILELFGKSNYILTKNDKIIGALREEEWAEREIRVGLDYKFPEPTTDPRGENYFDLLSDGEIVRRLASDLSLGGTYAEEACKRAKIDKNTAISNLSHEEKSRITNILDDLLGSEKNPALYVDDLPKRAAPFRLQKYDDLETETFETLSEAMDEYYYRRKKNEQEQKRKSKYNEKLKGLKRQKEQQQRKIKGLEKSSKQNRRNAELIYENYSELQKAKSALNRGLDDQGWDKVQQKIEESEKAKRLKTLNKRNKFFSYDVGEAQLKIYLNQDLEATASGYYDKAKDSEEKKSRAEEALEKTQEEIDKLSKEEIELDDDVMEDKSKKRNKKWFEKYRWFYSSDNYLILLGRDSQTNEMLVKKHMESNDLYLHADFDGAPSTVIKDGQEAPESTLEEAGRAAVTFTKAWKAGIGAADVYYVDPEQVTKEPEPGEYLAQGAFVIRGDREFLHNIKIDAAVGPYEIEKGVYVPFCGPESAVEEKCSEKVVLIPGNSKKSEIAKQINRKFKNYNMDLDYIIRSLPPGKSEIDKSK